MCRVEGDGMEENEETFCKTVGLRLLPTAGSRSTFMKREREREDCVCVCVCKHCPSLSLFAVHCTGSRPLLHLSLSLSTADSMHRSTWYVSFVIYTWNRYTIKSFFLLLLLLPPVSFSPFFLFSKRYITPCLLPLRLLIPLFSRFPNTLMETNRPLRDQSRQWFSPLLPSFHFSPSKNKMKWK